jgi:UTP--glucose-1-phosphate uridylyltransferase
MQFPKITKAIFPVAGLGTRFLPATKASPKEMLSIVDKPLIQYAVEEAIAAGITELIFITGRNKRSIEDHFDKAYELEKELAYNSKTKLLNLVKDIPPAHVNCIYIRQSEALGLGHAILRAKSVINNEPFAVILADELIDSKKVALKQLIDVYKITGNSVLGLYPVDTSQINQYGIVKTTTLTNHKHLKIIKIVEKPKTNRGLSNLAVVGRYIFHSNIFNDLAKVKKGVGNEIQLTDAISSMIKSQTVLGHIIDGTRYDCGSKLGFMQANVNYGIKHKEIGPEFYNFLRQLDFK